MRLYFYWEEDVMFFGGGFGICLVGMLILLEGKGLFFVVVLMLGLGL